MNSSFSGGGFTFRVNDIKTQKHYIIKAITPEDDMQFNDTVLEIAITKYIENN
jgi:hypothetical protein